VTVGTLVILRLDTAASPCVIVSGGWPDVRLVLADGTDPVGNAFPFGPATRAKPGPFVTYRVGKRRRTVLLLGSGRGAFLEVLSVPLAASSCQQTSAARIFPGVLSMGRNLRLALPAGVQSCGRAAVVTYLSSRIGETRAASIGQRALGKLDALCAANPSGFLCNPA